MARKKHTRSKPKSRKPFFLQHWQLLTIAFAFVTVGLALASTAFIAPKTSQPQTTAYDESVSVYRPADEAWVDIDLEDLQPFDFLLKDGKAYHIKAPYTTSSGQVQAIPLGQATRAALERHLENYDPEDKSFLQSDIELVYAKWEGKDLWTFQPLGKLANGDLFHHNGREFVTRVSLDGSRAVKPTGNVLSKVNGVWSEHHNNQIHLTLLFPDIGETNKIITTHEHPFYVPSIGEWIPAEFLKVGMDLQTCGGTPARVADWVLVDEPFTAWNIEVAHSHTYYVADPNNPNAPPVLVHNDCAPDALFANGGKQLDDDTIISGSGNKFVKQSDGTYKKTGPASDHEIISTGVGSNWNSPNSLGFKDWRSAQKYQDAPYHGSTGNPVKGARPTNPELALDNSYSFSSNTTR